MKTPQFLQSASSALVKGARAAWLAGPWRVLRPVHDMGGRAADAALDTCRTRQPGYYWCATWASGMTSFALAFIAGVKCIDMLVLVAGAGTAGAAALPVLGAAAAASLLAAGVGATRRSARRTEKYYLYENSIIALEQPAPPPVTPPLPQPKRGLFNRKATVATGEAIKPLKVLKIKSPAAGGPA